MKGAVFASFAAGWLMMGQAAAADMPVKAPVLVKTPAFSWTGCYINAGVGYGLWSQVHSVTSTNFQTPRVPNSFNSIEDEGGGHGWLGRFGGGCDYQLSGGLSNWVIGAFGDYDVMDLMGSTNSQLLIDDIPIQANEKESSAWAVGGRIGYLIAPMVLGYVDGGWTQARFDQMDLLFNDTGNPTGNAFPAHTYNGWFLGSGFDYAFTWLPLQGLFLRTEYRYAMYQKDDLQEFNIAFGNPAGNAGMGSVLHSQKDVQTVTTSLVWRFNWFH